MSAFLLNPYVLTATAVGSGGPWVPVNLGENLVSYFDFTDISTMELSGSDIYAIQSKGGYNNSLRNVTNYPTFSAETSSASLSGGQFLSQGFTSLDAAVKLPLIDGGTTGFTCVGFDYDPTDNTWWFGAFPDDICKLTPDFGEIILQIDAPTDLDGRSVGQGVCIQDGSDNIWVCSSGQNPYAFDKNLMTITNEISGYGSERIGWCEDDGYLFIGSSVVDLSGNFIFSVTRGDQIGTDSQCKIAYSTDGSNGSPGTLTAIYLDRQITLDANYILLNCDAIEGVYIDYENGMLYISNDAGYHNGNTNPPEDRVIIHNFQPVLIEDSYDVYMMAKEYPQVALGAAWSFGEPTSNFGIAQRKPAGDNSNQELILNTYDSTTERDSNIWVQDIITDVAGSGVIIDCINTQFKTVTNATESSFTSFTNATSGVLLPSLTVGAEDRYGNNSLDMDLYGLVVGRNLTTAQRQKLQGYLHWKHGKQDLLPLGHPYKTEAPTVNFSLISEPVIAGNVVGSPITVSNGTYDVDGLSYQYQWFFNGYAIIGATTNSYIPKIWDDSYELNCRVAATDGTDWIVTESDPVTIVHAAPINTVLPGITGTFEVGRVLNGGLGVWSGEEVSYDTQWIVDSMSVPGASGSQFTLTPDLTGSLIYYEVTATNTGGSVVATSVSGGPVTAPQNITNFVDTLAWWDASDSASITESGGDISLWEDLSGNGFDLTPPGNAPSVGTNSVTFDGFNSEYFTFSNLGTITEAGLYAVLKINTQPPGSTTQAAFVDITNDAATTRFYYPSTNNIIYANFVTSDRKTTDVVTEDLTTRHLLGITAKSNLDYDIRFAGNSFFNGSVSDISVRVGDHSIGAMGARYFDGEICEIVIAGSHSDAEREIVEGYLAHKWDALNGNSNLVDALPVSHPYKSSAPF